MELTQILASILEQTEHCSELHSCLEHEEQCLRRNQMNELEAVNEQKVMLVGKLEKSAIAYQLLVEQFLKQEDASTEDLLSSTLLSTQEKQQLETALAKLQTLSQECQTRNEVNGKVILVNKQINTQLVNMLKGIDANSHVYNATGKIDD